MRAIDFPQINETYAKSQPQFAILPLCKKRTEDVGVFEYISKHELTDLEIEQIVRTRCIYHTQLGNCLHPINMRIEDPFGFCEIGYRMTSPTSYHFFIPMADKTISELKCEINEAIEKLVEITKLKPEQLAFFEKPVLAIDANGNIVGI